MRGKLKVIFFLFLSLLVIYTLLRVGFCTIYFKDDIQNASIFHLFYWGLRIDFSSLFYINLIFLVYYFFLYNLLPVGIRNKIALSLLLLINIPFLAINFIDLAYFGFTARRSTSDLLVVLPDSLSSMPAFLNDYWYLFLLFILAVALLTITTKRILDKTPAITGKALKLQYIWALPVIILMALAARGTGDKPILPPTPLLYFEAQLQPLVTNSTFTFLYSLRRRKKEIRIKEYYTTKELDSLFTIRRQYPHEQPFQPKNVMVLILESFCKEYLQPGPYRANTPFLDSIIAHSTWCSNAYANGVKSTDGFIAVLGSMPVLQDDLYYHSEFSNNAIRGIGTILKEKGYATHFFMGAGPDHFGFGKFCKIVGIDQYHSRRDFNNDRYYDGNWGIFDHKFLSFMADELQKETKPFLSVFFSISAHSPYTLPPDLRDRFNLPNRPNYVNSISYVDYSLREFFDKIKHTSWYKNTLFVFTPDHSTIGHVKKAFDPHTAFRIPVFIHDPTNPVADTITRPVQQTDIVPTILDRLAYSGAFMSFGRSLRDTTDPYVVYKYGGLHEIIDSSFLLGYNSYTEQPTYMYNHRNDPTLKKNLLDLPGNLATKDRLLRHYKAIVQRYNNSLIRNQLYVK